MKTPIEIIQALDLTTHSIVMATSEFGERDYDLARYVDIGNEILGLELPSETNVKVARIRTMYVIQLTLNEYHSNTIPDMEKLALDALRLTDRFVEKHPWSAKNYTTEDETGEQGDAKPKRSKRGGWRSYIGLFNDNKVTMTRNELIVLFMERSGIPKTTATTYFYNCKNEYGYTNKPGEGKRGRKKKVVDNT